MSYTIAAAIVNTGFLLRTHLKARERTGDRKQIEGLRQVIESK